MGHQALHFSKAIQRRVGWPFCVERREERGGDEKAPSISPMRGSARLPLGILGWPFCVEKREGRGGDEEAPSISPMRGSARLPLGILGWPFCVVRVIPTGLGRKEEQQNIAEYISPCTKEKRPSWRAGRYGRK